MYSVCGIHKRSLVEALSKLGVTPAERRVFIIAYEAERRFHEWCMTRLAPDNDMLMWDFIDGLALPSQQAVPALSTDGAEREPGGAFLRARGYDLAADAMGETVQGTWLALPLNQALDIDASMEAEIVAQVADMTKKETEVPGADGQCAAPAEIGFIDPNLLLLWQAQENEHEQLDERHEEEQLDGHQEAGACEGEGEEAEVEEVGADEVEAEEEEEDEDEEEEEEEEEGDDDYNDDDSTVPSPTPSSASPCASPSRNDSAAQDAQDDSAHAEPQSLHDIVAQQLVSTLRPSLAARVSRKMAAGYNAAIASGVVVGLAAVKAPRVSSLTPPSTPPRPRRRRTGAKDGGAKTGGKITQRQGSHGVERKASSAQNVKKRKSGQDDDQEEDAVQTAQSKKRQRQQYNAQQAGNNKVVHLSQDNSSSSSSNNKNSNSNKSNNSNSSSSNNSNNSNSNNSNSNNSNNSNKDTPRPRRHRSAPIPPAAPRIAGTAPTPYVWSACEAEYAAIATRAYFAVSADRIADPDSAPRRTRATLLPDWPPEARLRMRLLKDKFEDAEAHAKNDAAQDADKAEFAGCADWATFAEQAEEAYFVLELTSTAA